MKVMIVVLTLLALLVTGTVCNYIYINEVCDRCLDYLDAIPEIDDAACGQQIDALIEYWENESDTVSLSVSYTVTDRMSEHAAVLSAAAACGDRYGFYTALVLVRDAIGDLRRFERFSIGNLL